MKNNIKGLAYILSTIIVLSTQSCTFEDTTEATQTGNPVNVSLVVQTDTSTFMSLAKALKIKDLYDSAVVFTKGLIVISDVRAYSTYDTLILLDSNQQIVSPMLLNGAPLVVDSLLTSDTGTYTHIRYTISKLDRTSDSLWNVYPELQGKSLYIRGYFGDDVDDPFVYTSEKLIHHEIQLIQPFTVTDSTHTKITMYLPIGHWFVGPLGVLLDPRLPGNTDILDRNWKIDLEIDDLD